MHATTTRPDRAELVDRLEHYRAELNRYCYRMLGSTFESDDAVQDTLLRAWRGIDGFDGTGGPSSLRPWLYRIATNVCVDALNRRRRRAEPIDLSSPTAPALESLGPPRPADPEAVTVSRESVRLAFVAAVAHLPQRQRAVLILRDVLAWPAREVADLLGTSVASVNSSLQRARARLAAAGPVTARRLGPVDATQHELLRRYTRAFERYDMGALVALLHADHRVPTGACAPALGG